MADDYFSLLPISPVRPPDWRIRLAAYYADLRAGHVATRPYQVPDVLVRQVLTVRHGWAWDEPPPADRAALLHTLAWRAAAPADTLAEVDARLLARQADAEIAAAVGVPVARVAYYERLFFDCRAKLDCQSYVKNVLLHEGGRPTVGGAVRACGYYHGSLALESVLAVVRADQRAEDPPRTVGEHEAALDRAAIRMWVADYLTAGSPVPLDLCELAMNIAAHVKPFGSLHLDPFVLPLYPNPAAGSDLRPHDGRYDDVGDVAEVRVSAKTVLTAGHRPVFDLSRSPDSVYDRAAVAGGRDARPRVGGATICAKPTRE